MARRQLLLLGLTPAAIDSRVRRGRLHVVFPGVYAVGHRRIGRLGRWQEAERLRLLDVAAVTALSSQPRRGARTLRALIATAADVAPTRSELEHRFADLIADHGLPTPHYKAPLLGYVVDAFWPAHKLVVELDSRAYHWHRHEQDRARDADPLTAGYRVYRLTWARLRDEPRAVAGQLRRLLA